MSDEKSNDFIVQEISGSGIELAPEVQYADDMPIQEFVSTVLTRASKALIAWDIVGKYDDLAGKFGISEMQLKNILCGRTQITYGKFKHMMKIIKWLDGDIYRKACSDIIGTRIHE